MASLHVRVNLDVSVFGVKETLHSDQALLVAAERFANAERQYERARESVVAKLTLLDGTC